MRQTISLDGNDPIARKLARATFPSYNGRKFEIIVTDTVCISGDNWSGGSRSTYVAFTLSTDPQSAPLPRNDWRASSVPSVALAPGFGIAEHVLFCGKDLGLRFHIHPENAAPLLPAGDTLPETDALVLAAHRCLKSFARREALANRCGINGAAFDAAVERLKASGHVAKNGGITPKGRNAVKESDVRKL